MIESEMLYSHIVKIHPIESGETNLHKIKCECEYETVGDAENCVLYFNENNELYKAVYFGCVNNETGELV